jgi:hypothetical protein
MRSNIVALQKMSTIFKRTRQMARVSATLAYSEYVLFMISPMLATMPTRVMNDRRAGEKIGGAEET